MVDSRCIFDLNQQVLFYTLHAGEGRASLPQLYPTEEHVKWIFMGTHFWIQERERWDHVLKICGQISPFLMCLLLPDGPFNVIYPFPADYGNADYEKAFLLSLLQERLSYIK